MALRRCSGVRWRCLEEGPGGLVVALAGGVLCETVVTLGRGNGGGNALLRSLVGESGTRNWRVYQQLQGAD